MKEDEKRQHQTFYPLFLPGKQSLNPFLPLLRNLLCLASQSYAMWAFKWERYWDVANFTVAMVSFSEAHPSVRGLAPWLSGAVRVRELYPGFDYFLCYCWKASAFCFLPPSISLQGMLQVPSGVQIPLFFNIYRDRAPWWANSTILFCELFLKTQPIACSCRAPWFCKHLITSFKCLSVYNS